MSERPRNPLDAVNVANRVGGWALKRLWGATKWGMQRTGEAYNKARSKAEKERLDKLWTDSMTEIQAIVVNPGVRPLLSRR